MQPQAILIFIAGYYLIYVFLLLFALQKIVAWRKIISGGLLLLAFFFLSLFYFVSGKPIIMASASFWFWFNLLFMVASLITLLSIVPNHQLKEKRGFLEKVGILLVLGGIPILFIEGLWMTNLLSINNIQITHSYAVLILLSMILLYFYRTTWGYLAGLMLISFMFYLSASMTGIEIYYSLSRSLTPLVSTIFLGLSFAVTAWIFLKNLAN